jgi:signal transduction histidine kinase/coenzyme F420-reducing hydrogenase delta subunit
MKKKKDATASPPKEEVQIQLKRKNSALERLKRELKIEASLERVRARTMAMHHSDELSDVLAVLFQQFDVLNIRPVDVHLDLFDLEKNTFSYRATGKESKRVIAEQIVDLDSRPEWQALVEKWKSGKPNTVAFSFYPKEVIRELMAFFPDIWAAMPEDAIMSPEDFPDGIFDALGYCKFGYIGFHHYRSATEEEKEILIRFANEFERLYQRFLDLQKAEAQAREAQIQLALERVRATTMAMQKSDELSDAVYVLFQQFKELGEDPDQATIGIINEDEKVIEYWVTMYGQPINKVLKFSIDEPNVTNKIYKAWKENKKSLVIDLSGNALTEFVIYRAGKGGAAINPDEKRRIINVAFFSKGLLNVQSNEKRSEESIKLLERFAKVFEQTYTRFLDLQKAEAQARESQIQLALERVRARTMAMERSDELAETSALMFKQIKELGILAWSSGFSLWHDNDTYFIGYNSTPSGGIGSPLRIPLTEDVFFKTIREAKHRGEEFFVFESEGESLAGTYRYMDTLPVVGDFMREIVKSGYELPKYQVTHCGFFPQGHLMFITLEPHPEAWDIFKRFTKVFEQTYTRFLDLKKAEAQALEAIKRASVDRVRAEIASMRTTSDLERITPLIWNELTTLGVPFIRCGVFVMDEEQEQVQSFLSTPDGKAIAAFRQPYNTPGEIAEIIAHWHKKKMYKQHWNEAQFIEFTKNLVQQGAITSGEKYLTENRPTDLYLHFLPFLQGMLYVGSTIALSDNELQLVQNLADAFSTAYARYEDFNKLESANIKIEKTLVDLKQTQAQLVQSEKMASLGELTAGIAHEIQNPLNFVNNFSEVNKELIAEMNEEIRKGNYDEVKAIAEDVKDNQEKINHHGKRADAIVKGMLQHSRSSSGIKEPTDINALADEYLRLAYHGLRAKDNSFNATMKTDYDASIGNINIIPQDIGRVILNIITNAFYAVTEKEKQMANGFEPTVSVCTKKTNGKVEIKVGDNGNGIPQKVLEKIFQPFFTTKPTGQGTGLGLSLSYDIVKSHGGEIKVNTLEGEFTEFVVHLPVSE